MGYAELIAKEAENLPEEKQAEILDFIVFLKTRQDRNLLKPTATESDIVSFFQSFHVKNSSYRFDREDANAR